MAIKTKRRINMATVGCSCSLPGIWQAVAHNEGAAVIFHSSKGCGHVTRDMDLGNFYRSLGRRKTNLPKYTAPLIISGIEEEHSIFGGAEQLRECIAYVMQEYQPEYIVIANSCVAGVIGDDVDSVAAEAEEKWQKPVISLPASGFLAGNFHGGYHETAKALLKYFVKPQPRESGKVLLLGDRNGIYGQDAREIKRLLEYFGLDGHCAFPSYCNLDDLAKVSASQFCLVSSGSPQAVTWGRKLAGILKKDYGVDFFAQAYPSSWESTKQWLLALGGFLNKPENALWAVEEEERRLSVRLKRTHELLGGQKVLFFIGRPLLYFQPQWVLEILSLAKIEVTGIILSECLTEKQQNEIREVLRARFTIPIVKMQDCDWLLEMGDFFVTTEELLDSGKNQFILPMLPPAGVEGIAALCDKLVRVRSKKKGGVTFG